MAESGWAGGLGIGRMGLSETRWGKTFMGRKDALELNSRDGERGRSPKEGGGGTEEKIG